MARDREAPGRAGFNRGGRLPVYGNPYVAGFSAQSKAGFGSRVAVWQSKVLRTHCRYHRQPLQGRRVIRYSEIPPGYFYTIIRFADAGRRCASLRGLTLPASLGLGGDRGVRDFVGMPIVSCDYAAPTHRFACRRQQSLVGDLLSVDSGGLWSSRSPSASRPISYRPPPFRIDSTVKVGQLPAMLCICSSACSALR